MRSSLLLTLFVLSEQIDGAPVATKSAAATSKAQNSNLGTVKPLKKSKGGRPVARSSPLNDVDTSKLSFSELVKMKPKDHRLPEGQKYRDAFANHPKVQAIDLHSTDRAGTIQALLDLHEEGDATVKGDNRGWKRQLTTSIKDHIERTPFKDEIHKKTLLDTWDGTRLRALSKGRQEKHRDKIGVDGIKRKREQFHAKYRQAHGISHQAASRRLSDANPMMNQSLSYYLHDNHQMDAMQIAQATRHLAQYFTSKTGLTMELDRYLKERKVPQDQYEAAMALRAKDLYDDTKKKRTAKGKGDSSTEGEVMHMQHTSTLTHPTMKPILHAPGTPDNIQDHRPSSPSLHHPLLDLHNPKEWQWLTDYLHEDT